MCLAPITLQNGLKTSCHKCWQCFERAIDDWTGRNVAESKTAVASHAVTLTYGRVKDDPDHLRAALLTYSDVQKFIKRLRFHGYPVRYFVTGEFGSLKGRAHWHIILYWLKGVPSGIRLEDRYFQFEHWEHGFAFFQKPDHGAIRYNCKYVLKDVTDAAWQGHIAMSKKPPLGAAYFELEAQRYVDQGLAPQTLEYSFPEVTRRKDGFEEKVTFRLKDTSAERFLQAYLDRWEIAYPGREFPRSNLVEEYVDPGSWNERVDRLKPWVDPPMPKGVPRTPPMDFIDVRNELDRTMKDGTEQQQLAEQAFRALEDGRRWHDIETGENYYEEFPPFDHDNPANVWDRAGSAQPGIRRKLSEVAYGAGLVAGVDKRGKQAGEQGDDAAKPGDADNAA